MIQISPELIVGTGVVSWGLVYGFHQIVVSKEFKRIDHEIEGVKQDISRNSEDLADIKSTVIDTKISLAKIEEKTNFVFESVKEMKTEVKRDISSLYQKIEALFKNK